MNLSTVRKCKGENKDGSPCQRKIRSGEYCHQHESQAESKEYPYTPPLTTSDAAPKEKGSQTYFWLRWHATLQANPHWAFWGFAVTIIITIISLTVDLPEFARTIAPPPPPVMEGDFNIAIMPYQVLGQGDGLPGAERLSQNITNSIDKKIRDYSDSANLFVEIRGPSQLEPISGLTVEERIREASKRAQELDADIVVYGFIELNGSNAVIKSEFYINYAEIDTALDSPISGYYQAAPIVVDDINSNVNRRDKSESLADVFTVLLDLFIGVSHYVLGDYDSAILYYQEAQVISSDLPGWGNNEVIWVMLGNAYLKKNDLAGAMEMYQNAIKEKPDYARAFIGLGSTFYLRGVGENLDEGGYEDINLSLLNEAIAIYQQALSVEMDHPPLADGRVRASFGLGQAYFMHSMALLAQEGIRVDEAVVLQQLQWATGFFNQVINDYNNGHNQRVVELAAESYGNLGFIDSLTNESREAISLFQQALRLLPCKQNMQVHRERYSNTIFAIYENKGDSALARLWLEQLVANADTCTYQRQWAEDKLNYLS